MLNSRQTRTVSAADPPTRLTDTENQSERLITRYDCTLI